MTIVRGLVILSWLLVISLGTIGSSKPFTRTKVLILGAGAAGLTAAKTLSDNNIHDFIILEGSNRIGGRVKSVQFAGKTVEAGANWIVGEEGNPLNDIAQNEKIMGKWTDWDSVIIRNSKGEDVTDTEGENAWNKLAVAQNKSQRIVKQIKKSWLEMSTRACLALGQWMPETPVEKVVEVFDYDFEYGNTPDVFSCPEDNTVPDPLDRQYFVQDSRGYEFILKKYVEDVLPGHDTRIHLNEVVTEIRRRGKRVRVKTRNGNVFIANYAIVTFSVGVLQSGLVTFVPELPDWKRNNLFRIRFENYFGIYLKFPDTMLRFWDKTEFILYADERRGYYPVWQNHETDGLYYPGANILEIVAFGEDGDRVSQLNNTEITAEVMEILRRVYKNPNIPDPEEILVPNWKDDPMYLGSFPNLGPGTRAEGIIEKITAPVGRIYFAGDAYDAELIGYVFGSIRSAKKAALQIASLN